MGCDLVLQKINSDGQTGADRVALDVALQYGLHHGGAIPRGRRTESGRRLVSPITLSLLNMPFRRLKTR